MTHTLHLRPKSSAVKLPPDARADSQLQVPAGLGPPLPLPHERDESVDPDPREPDAALTQAAQDIDGCMVDTDMRATPGLDARTRNRLVPGPGGNPPGRRR